MAVVQRILAIISGKWQEYVPLQTSAGATSAGSIVALNAAGLVDPTMLGFTSGSNTNGKWRKRPDGVIEQTGTVTLSAGAATITFPIPFANSCDNVELTAISNSSATDLSVYLKATPTTSTASVVGTVTTVGVGAAVNAATFSVLWSAVGT